MRTALTLWCLFICLAASSQKFIDPTGSYRLNVKSREKNGEIFGWFGDIKVKLLDSNRLAMSFFICRGAPSYNSGSFADTLVYRNNTAVYEKECKVTFTFSGKYIQVKEEPEAGRGTCWGYGVYAFGPYKKYAAKPPVIRHPLTGE
ncbi:MAG TPA: hypothetical protein VEB42_04170 [Chitinophagaceae bacterium]|nr:hypothetical protein [Chitinophagaceae bacterium]